MLNGLLEWLHTVFVVRLDYWVILGFIAQALFMMRFVVQWIASERVGKSIVPVAFWFFSIGGSLLLLIYSIKRQDPVFIAGQGLGMVIYFRNLWLIYREKRRNEDY
ncbi:lipid-A-disaccharide synthase N-terminal domain-containing protein [Polycladidibacter stylochi]|uniref:lipid-A-disaccharide synthase N-terminal domain-containing protein n=1 Tax=Polycladidibacter stylochi TaxID=1807766 RepID=UPI00082D672E|nr:lipid-A-disaccharide synthase N-terminal domain-containing protein [Pseudovibrio stylochi]